MAPGQLRKKAKEIVDSLEGVETAKAKEIREAWQKNWWKQVIKLGDEKYYNDFLKPESKPESKDSGFKPKS